MKMLCILSRQFVCRRHWAFRFFFPLSFLFNGNWKPRLIYRSNPAARKNACFLFRYIYTYNIQNDIHKWMTFWMIYTDIIIFIHRIEVWKWNCSSFSRKQSNFEWQQIYVYIVLNVLYWCLILPYLFQYILWSQCYWNGKYLTKWKIWYNKWQRRKMMMFTSFAFLEMKKKRTLVGWFVGAIFVQ